MKSGKLEKLKHLYLHRIAIDCLLKLGKRVQPNTISLGEAIRIHGERGVNDEYSFDAGAATRRARDRFAALSAMVDMARVTDTAELGAGDGSLALLMQRSGCQALVLDIEDWMDDEVAGAGVRFVKVQEEGAFDVPSDSVDLFLSYNTMEHVSNPEQAIREIIRITRPGGHIYLSFCPIYNSPWGLHAFSSFGGPYAQFLLSQDDLDKFIEEYGVHDLGRQRDHLQYVNGWSYSRYRALFKRLPHNVRVKSYRVMRNFKELPYVYRYPQSFLGRCLSYRELTTEGIEILMEVTR